MDDKGKECKEPLTVETPDVKLFAYKLFGSVLTYGVFGMDYSFHYLLMAAQALFQRGVMAELNGSGLTAGQPKVLDYLGLHDGSVQKSIAAGCQIDPATLTGLLNRMEEKGLIRRCKEQGNRRSLHVYLTEQGWEKQWEVRQTLERRAETVLAGLSEEQRTMLLDSLYQICASMADMEGLQ